MDVEIRRVPLGPLGQIWDERVRDWMEESPRYVQLYLDYREQHYKKICSKCTHAQKVKRKCALLIPGFDEQHCRHIDLAFASKHRTVIQRRYESHPFMQRILMNLELERRRREQEGKAQGGMAARPADKMVTKRNPPHPFSRRARGRP